MSSTIRRTATAKIRSLFAANNLPGKRANTSLKQHQVKAQSQQRLQQRKKYYIAAKY